MDPKQVLSVAVEVEFFATDPDGNLDHYELKLLWSLGNVRDLLAVAGASLVNVSPAPDNHAGPDYANAIAQGLPSGGEAACA